MSRRRRTARARRTRSNLVLVLAASLILAIGGGTTPVRADEPGSWLQVRTDHFTVIYQERDENAAREVLAVADRVFRDTTRYMDYRPRERVPVVLYGGTAAANGFFSPYPPHIALFVAAPAGPWLGARTESWLETVFIHELIHYLHLTRPIGFFGTASWVFGPLTAAASTVFMPGWTVEGVAVHGESWLAPGGRGDNPFFEMQAIAPVLEGRMYSYDQAGSPSAYAPRGRIYTAGYLMVDYLRREYGDDAFLEMNRTFQRAPFLGMRRAVRRTTGVRAPDFFDQMILDLERRYEARRDLPSGEIVTPEGPGDWFLPIPTDRGLIAWGRGFDHGPGLYLHDTGSDADGWRLIAPVSVAEERSWTVDHAGKTAVVSVIVPALRSGGIAPAMGESHADLFMIELAEAAGGRSRRITTERRLFFPALSPDGRRLVAMERQGSYGRLVSVDIYTGAVTALWEPDRTSLSGLTFSPDGRFIALTANRYGRRRLVIIEAESGAVSAELHPESGEAYYFPRFVGEREDLELWFSGDRTGALALYRSRVQGADEGTDDHDTRVTISSAELVLQDQVAAWSGIREHRGTILYGSYSADGHVIKRSTVTDAPQDNDTSPRVTTPARHAESIPADAPPPRVTPPPRFVPPEHAAVPQPRPYRDVPRPVLWLPQVMARSGSDGSEDDRLDLGIFSTAASNLGRHTVDLSVLYNFEADEPTGEISYTFAPGITRWNVLAARDDRATRLGLSVSRPLWFDQHPGFYRALAGSAGIAYETTGTTEEAAGAVRARLARSAIAAPRDFFGSTGREVSLLVNAVPDMLDNGTPRLETTTAAAVRLQPLQRRSGMIGALQVAPAAYIATSTAGDALGRLPYRSGGFDDRRTAGTADTTGTAAHVTNADLAWLGRLEIRVPLGIHDAAWRGLATTGSGLALYLEQGGAVTTAPEVLPTASSVAGTEYTMDLYFNMIPLRVTAGAALRLPHPDSAAGRDWTVYFRLGGPAAEFITFENGRIAPERSKPFSGF